MTKVMVMMMIM